jgi:hypothetical protein
MRRANLGDEVGLTYLVLKVGASPALKPGRWVVNMPLHL